MPDVADEQTVIKVLEQVLGRELPGAGPATKLFEELNLDSTAVLEVLMTLEEELGVAFDPETLEPDHLSTVDALLKFIRANG